MAQVKLETEVRRVQFVQAALALIAAEGLKALSVARVARRVGLVPSATYRHFRSKHHLLQAVIELIEQRMHANVKTASGISADPLECLRSLLMDHIRMIRENQGILRIVFSDELHGGHPGKKARLYKMITGYLDRVATLIASGQRLGRIRRDIDAETLAVMFLGMIQPAAILWNMSEGEFDISKHAERAWPAFCVAVAPDGAAAGGKGGRRLTRTIAVRGKVARRTDNP